MIWSDSEDVEGVATCKILPAVRTYAIQSNFWRLSLAVAVSPACLIVHSMFLLHSITQLRLWRWYLFTFVIRFILRYNARYSTLLTQLLELGSVGVYCVASPRIELWNLVPNDGGARSAQLLGQVILTYSYFMTQSGDCHGYARQSLCGIPHDENTSWPRSFSTTFENITMPYRILLLLLVIHSIRSKAMRQLSVQVFR